MKRVAHEEQRGVPVRRGRAGRARERQMARTKRLFRRLFLRFRRRPSRTPPRSPIPPGRPHRGSRGLAFGPGRDPRAEVAPAGQVHVRRLRGADRGWVRVCHDVFDRGQRSPAQRPRIGARPVVRLVRRAARRHAQPPRSTHREDRVDEQAHVPPRGTVRCLPHGSRSRGRRPRIVLTRALGRRDGMASRSPRPWMEKTSRSRSGDGESSASAERRHSCYFTALFTLILHPLAPRRRDSRVALRSRPESEHLPRRPRRGSRPRRREKMVAAANSTLRTPKTRVGARDAQPSV